MDGAQRRDLDGQLHDVELSGDFAAVPDAFQRLWTPHRMVYIENNQRPEKQECPFCVAPTL